MTSVDSTTKYQTGAAATTIYNAAKQQSDDGHGGKNGSFTELLGFTNNGGGIPSGLQTAFTDHKSDVPLIGIFDDGSGSGCVVVYIIAH
jgi:hypothetical protein